MATVNDTLSRTQSKPEKVAKWLFTTSGNYRQILGFLLIAALTIISIRFNYELGKLSAVDATSGQLLPAGYPLSSLFYWSSRNLTQRRNPSRNPAKLN